MSAFHETTQRTAGHIRQQFTLQEIADQIETGEYNAELMLQHLLLCTDSLQRENAALREAFAKADVMYEYGRDDGQRRWVTFSMWIRKGQIVVLMDTAALIAARIKETQP